jgi:PAS domain-containing protein
VASAQCEPCTVRPCAGYEAIDDVLEVAAGTEQQLFSEIERTARERTMTARLAEAAQQIATIQKLDELVAAIPDLALLVYPGASAALLQVKEDDSLKVVARRGPPFQALRARLAEEARAAVRALAGRPQECTFELGCCRVAQTAVIPLEPRAEGMVLALERAASQGPSSRSNDHLSLSLYASIAGAALALARAGEALQETAARDAATLGAIREGVIAVDRDGIVRSLNDVAAATLGVRREDVLGRRLRQVPGLSALGLAPGRGFTGRAVETAAVPRGEVMLRSRPYDGGVVASIRDVATERAAARRTAGSAARFTFDHLVGSDPAFLRVLEDAKRAAGSEIPILVCGESGTGKEMLAQAIHNASPGAGAPFLGINVTAIPRELLESELFGYERGAFTGAHTSGRGGKFELAGRGTLLLDEIGDMPLEMQGKLLRVLQERIVSGSGSVRDIRTPASSPPPTAIWRRPWTRALPPRPLPPAAGAQPAPPAAARAQGGRAAARRAPAPAPRERSRRRVRIAPEVLAAFQAHDWPGNVRELLNLLEAELSISPGAGRAHADPAGPAAGAGRGPAGRVRGGRGALARRDGAKGVRGLAREVQRQRRAGREGAGRRQGHALQQDQAVRDRPAGGVLLDAGERDERGQRDQRQGPGALSGASRRSP